MLGTIGHTFSAPQPPPRQPPMPQSSPRQPPAPQPSPRLPPRTEPSLRLPLRTEPSTSKALLGTLSTTTPLDPAVLAGAADGFASGLIFEESCAGAASNDVSSPSTISASSGWRGSAENCRRKFGGLELPESSERYSGGSGVCPTTVDAASSRTATPRRGRGMRTINFLLCGPVNGLNGTHGRGRVRQRSSSIVLPLSLRLVSPSSPTRICFRDTCLLASPRHCPFRRHYSIDCCPVQSWVAVHRPPHRDNRFLRSSIGFARRRRCRRIVQ